MYKAPSMSLFDAHPTQIFTRALPTTLQGVKDRVHSKSYISVLPEEKRQDLSKRIEDMFENGGSELGRTWVDEKQGVWEYVSRRRGRQAALILMDLQICTFVRHRSTALQHWQVLEFCYFLQLC